MKFTDLMNIENIYLKKIEEPEDNYLRLTLIRANISNIPEDIHISDEIIKNVSSIDFDNSKPLIQVDFKSYIGYSVLNESFTSLDNYDDFIGRAFRIYNKSRYLDYINVGTFASKDYPGPFVQYGIACLNHIIDVVSSEEPIIKEIQEESLYTEQSMGFILNVVDCFRIQGRGIIFCGKYSGNISIGESLYSSDGLIFTVKGLDIPRKRIDENYISISIGNNSELNLDFYKGKCLTTRRIV